MAEKSTNYREAISQLLSLVDHERALVDQDGFPERTASGPRQKSIFDLTRIEALLESLGSPHKKAFTVHVAGTKGKGSTAALCDSALHAAGFKTGFYSSPHLHFFRERIRLETQPISEATFVELVEQVWPHHLRMSGPSGPGAVTFFEFLTAMAFACFANENVDFQTIEVGLGGRLDATNVVEPSVSVITPISYYHTAILGETLTEIAGEKAGIIKPGAPVVVAPQPPEAQVTVEKVSRRLGTRLIQVGRDVNWERIDGKNGVTGNIGQHLEGQSLIVRGRLSDYRLDIPLLGTHQLINSATAVAALEVLREQGHDISEDAIQEGFAKVSWPCRMEVLARSPTVVADGAHNLHSMDALLNSLPDYLSYRRLILIAGFSKERSVKEMIDRLVQVDPVVITTASRHPRSLAPDAVAEHFESHGFSAAVTDCPKDAVSYALGEANKDDLILITGSLFVAAEAREAVLGIEPELYTGVGMRFR